MYPISGGDIGGQKSIETLGELVCGRRYLANYGAKRISSFVCLHVAINVAWCIISLYLGEFGGGGEGVYSLDCSVGLSLDVLDRVATNPLELAFVRQDAI